MSTIGGNWCHTQEMFLFTVKSEGLEARWPPREKKNLLPFLTVFHRVRLKDVEQL